MSEAKPASRRSLGILFSIVIVDLIGFGIVMPILPYYSRAFGADGFTLGALLSIYAAAQFVFAPLWGRLSDRIGRRPVLVMTVAGTAAALVAAGFADSLLTLFLARLFGGMFGANVSVASAYIADATAEDERTRWMGLLGASFAIGFVLGPAIGGLLAPLGHHVPLLAAGGLAALNAVHAALRLPEPERRAADTGGAASGGRFAALRNPVLRRLCAINLVFSLAVTQLESMFQLFLADRFGWDAREAAFLLVGMAVVMGGVQGGGMKALSARFPEKRLVGAGAAGLAIAFFAMPAAPTIAMLLLPLTLAAVSRALVQPSLMGLASTTANAAEQGLALGAFQSAASLARVFGPLLAGALFDRNVGDPFLLAGGLVLVVALLSRWLPERASAAGAAPGLAAAGP